MEQGSPLAPDILKAGSSWLEAASLRPPCSAKGLWLELYPIIKKKNKTQKKEKQLAMKLWANFISVRSWESPERMSLLQPVI